jgi:hypothetical protein
MTAAARGVGRSRWDVNAAVARVLALEDEDRAAPQTPPAALVGTVQLPAGCGTGEGRVDFEDGGFFEGRWERGQVEGAGTLQSAGGEYVGEFCRGKMHGRGCASPHILFV